MSYWLKSYLILSYLHTVDTFEPNFRYQMLEKVSINTKYINRYEKQTLVLAIHLKPCNIVTTDKYGLICYSVQLENFRLLIFFYFFYLLCILSVNFLLRLELVKKFSVGVMLKATLVFIFGPELETRIWVTT